MIKRYFLILRFPYTVHTEKNPVFQIKKKNFAKIGIKVFENSLLREISVFRLSIFALLQYYKLKICLETLLLKQPIENCDTLVTLFLILEIVYYSSYSPEMYSILLKGRKAKHKVIQNLYSFQILLLNRKASILKFCNM